jgi:outer membrane protein assembly factor BamB
MDLSARKLLWNRPVEETAFLSASKKQVLMRGRQIESIDSGTGRTLWTCAAEGCGPVTTIRNRVYFVDSGKQSRLVALQMNTGRKLWSIPGIRSCDGFALLGDTGFIKTTDGIVHAFSLTGVE